MNLLQLLSTKTVLCGNITFAPSLFPFPKLCDTFVHTIIDFFCVSVFWDLSHQHWCLVWESRAEIRRRVRKKMACQSNITFRKMVSHREGNPNFIFPEVMTLVINLFYCVSLEYQCISENPVVDVRIKQLPCHTSSNWSLSFAFYIHSIKRQQKAFLYFSDFFTFICVTLRRMSLFSAWLQIYITFRCQTFQC